MFCGECGSSSTATPVSRRRPDPRPSDTTVIPALPPARHVVSVPVEQAPAPQNAEPGAAPGAVSTADVPAETARWMAASAPASGQRFQLQFSTGETISVAGTGLLGRRPLPEPAEYFDHLIQINDVGMSVSKSHLEFGQDEGRLWVSDRYSANGTVVRRPGERAIRCEPGRRYLVPRGTRVEIAEQFFMVS
ncbi:FHA domain-containing protein [Cryobacterium tepidiphilum]|jgi:hypothetical protein|uniref:FHA domain-containing protein n=2 Tax=Cryobacterium tepidiphilum TaxID=2486026 RepID=A0A3M8LEA3_9MICO|nr:FHA domain-containing protein [Cryobacterium tepidiphilum]